MNAGFAKFRSRVMNPASFRLFLLAKLPLVYFTGIRIVELDQHSCITTARYGWFNRNPFGSLYFAVMQMAAELSTGTLCMAHSYGMQPSMSMLVVKTEGIFHKKAIGKIHFRCNDGTTIAAVIAQATQSGEGQQVRCYSVATNEQDEIVGEFWITWSVRVRREGVGGRQEAEGGRQ